MTSPREFTVERPTTCACEMCAYVPGIMTRALQVSASALALSLALAGCGAANVTNDPDRNLSPAERAQPPARTSLDETDGPTAPRGSAQRPIGEGAGYEEDENGGESE